ncbi:glycosyltransferase family 2 protein [Mesobaculum littorinae]|uniref:Glycosyltransferase family 2 protein n=1 Tax=Mesobaculum littorinae TaxID=2486419 RepID=A0A438AFY8_9RHOB|nr:glycosyltransferase family A protein [Mesobaculum littorinae]RVV97623.1 glycosyltransferase family 2 protein [Mesobaculum littorinae]
MTTEPGANGLSVVIPVWNLPDDLRLLLGQIERMGVFSEVIVVDDGSDPACDPERLGVSEMRLGARLLYLRSDAQRGAGHARNRGLEAVTCDNVIFFDADDCLTDDFPMIWARHLGQGMPDFTIFRHSDTRILAAEGRDGSFRFEESLWSDVLADRDERLLTHEQMAQLSPIVAYPWNKIYRTDYLRRENIDCSETRVHNDIRLHWLSFVRATRVLALRHVGAVHKVDTGQRNLTNLRGEERLCLADVLGRLTQDIRSTPRSALFMRSYVSFVHNVCMWNYRQADHHLQHRFADLACRAYLDFLPEEFSRFADWQPDTADEIVHFLMREVA